MIRYPVQIKLLSETTFGSGESQNGMVNEDILVDNEGMPYFSGKTFKGCLRKNIDDILKPFYLVHRDKLSRSFSSIMEELFGIGSYKKDLETKENQEDIGYQRDGKLKFSNFYLHTDIADIFDKNNKDEILDILTDIRFSIRMNEKLGVADKGSLRAIRVLKKDLVFVGFIECEEKLEENEFNILRQGILSLKHLGINKSRGKGRVEISIKDALDYNKGNLNTKNIDINSDYLFYELDLKEPIKIGDSSSKYDYEESKLYITGSAMRGAIIKQYLNKETLDLDILKNVSFSDSYPIYFDSENSKKRYSFPTPNIFVISKDTDKSDEVTYSKDKFSNLLDELQNEQEITNDRTEEKNKERRVIKLKKGSFSYYVEEKNKKTLYQFDVKKDFRFHHSNSKEKENIFRYESISKNQQFYGVIDISRLDNSHKKKFIDVFERISILYLGGSRTGGYGRTEITNIEGIKDFKKLKQKLNYLNYKKCDKEVNDIYLLSDLIARDESHQIVSNFPVEYLKENLQSNNIEILNSQINPTIIKGFNSKWKSHIPQVYAMEKGSVIRIKGKIEEDKVYNFMNKYHGDKVQDGLGRVIINPVFLDIDSIEYKSYKGQAYNQKRNMDECIVDKNIIQEIKKMKKEACINTKIKEYINKNINDKDVDKLSLNQISNVIYEIDKCIMDDKNRKYYLQKLKQISTNENRTKDNRSILNIQIDNKVNLQDILDTNNKDKREYLLNEVFGKNNSIINGLDKNKIVLKIVKMKLYYITKIIKIIQYQKEGDKNE